MEATKKPSAIEPNSIVLKIEDVLHVFLLDKHEIFNIPSIPISDVENIYEWMKPSQISFSHIQFSSIDDKPIEVKNYENFENIKYHIKDLYSITIFDKDNNETAAEIVLKEGSLNNIIKNILSGEKK